MLRQLFVAIGCLTSLAAVALANGRPPATSTIKFRKGMDSHVIAGMTFGMLESRDSGATWHWACEDAVGYAGIYDPDYTYTATGAVFATTFRGLMANRYGCVYDLTSLGELFVSTVTHGPDDTIYAAVIDPLNASVYKSSDNGLTFQVAGTPGQVGDQYSALEVAPSDPNRIYSSGYRYVPNPNGDPGNVKVHTLFRSDNGGQSWTSLPVGDFQTMPFSTIDIVGISSSDASAVFARVNLEDNTSTDAIYRSTDAGLTWTKISSKVGPVAVLVRGNGDLIVASAVGGAERSTNMGASWTPLAGAPHISCLAENAAGELWACTQNYGTDGDGHGIMKSRDLVSWMPVLKYEDIADPIACAVGTVQKDSCDTVQWCALCAQLGCDAKRACPTDGDGVVKPPKDGCCQGSSAPETLLIVLVIATLLRWRRAKAF